MEQRERGDAAATAMCCVFGARLEPDSRSPEFADTCFRLLCVSARIAREDVRIGYREPRRWRRRRTRLGAAG